jgi:hypothetical protein
MYYYVNDMGNDLSTAAAHGYPAPGSDLRKRLNPLDNDSV